MHLTTTLFTKQIRLALAALSMLLLWTSTPPLSAGSLVFFDDFESGLSRWTATGFWGLTTARSVSPSSSAHQEPSKLSKATSPD